MARASLTNPAIHKSEPLCMTEIVHGDFSIYLCHMRHLLLQDFVYFEVTNLVNVLIFAVNSSQCAAYTLKSVDNPVDQGRHTDNF